MPEDARSATDGSGAGQPRILLGHGSGGRLYRDLVRDVFLAHFDNPVLARLDDAAALVSPGRIALTTDAHVVQPLVFAGGDIGRLAVAGTVNDLATAAARPLGLAAAFVIEEGFEIARLHEICASMAATAAESPVAIVTGDTKVVQRGAADGLFITTTGVGEITVDHEVSAAAAAAGRRAAPLGHAGRPRPRRAGGPRRLQLHASTCAATARRSGVSSRRPWPPAGRPCTSCATPPAAASPRCWPSSPRRRPLGIDIDEESLPVSAAVRSACDLLGYDPLALANEGKMVFAVAPEGADAVLAALRGRPEGARAARIGTLGREHPGRVALRTAYGTRRVVDMPVGELLPRIC